MWTACWCLKSPRSLSGTSTHPTMLTQRSQPWSWIPFTLCQSALPFLSSVPSYCQSVCPKQTTLEEDRELFTKFSSILCLWFEIQARRADNFFDWVLNTVLRLGYFKLLPWKFKAKVKGYGSGHGQKQGHIVSPGSNSFASFSIRPTILSLQQIFSEIKSGDKHGK